MGRGLPAGVPGVKPENEWPGASAGLPAFPSLCASGFEGVGITAESVAAPQRGCAPTAERAPTEAGPRPGVPATPRFAK
jgi:hypothetical protein